MENDYGIVFGFYKDGGLIGYRQDTMGTIGKHAKLYSSHTKSQVDTVLENITYNLKSPTSGLGSWIKERNPKMGAIFNNSMRQVNKTLTDAKAFEVRVLKAPAYEYTDQYLNEKLVKIPVYPQEAMNSWKEQEKHEVLETHLFSLEGELNLQ